jgi:hypothetical protein
MSRFHVNCIVCACLSCLCTASSSRMCFRLVSADLHVLLSSYARAPCLPHACASASCLSRTAEASQRLLDEYRAAAMWSSNLVKWSAVERAAHFVHALSLLPDNRHSVDRLAAALAEAKAEADAAVVVAGGAAAAAGGGGGAAAGGGGAGNVSERDEETSRDEPAEAAAAAAAASALFGRARALLLHYSLLRGVVQHPLQRPLHLVRGIAARPVWKSDASVHFPWLSTMTDPRTVAAMMSELPPPGGWGRGRGLMLSAQPEGVHLGGAWGELHLLEAGRPHAENAARCVQRRGAYLYCFVLTYINFSG